MYGKGWERRESIYCSIISRGLWCVTSGSKGKNVLFAKYVREIIRAHLSKSEFSEQFENEFERILASGKFDDKIVETFLRAYGNLKK